MSLRFLTGGESHGKALVGVLDGIPSGLSLDAETLARQLRRRKLGYGRGGRQKIEDDAVEILSGVRHGKTLGSPVSLLIWNRDWQAWQEEMAVEAPASGTFSRRAGSRRVSVPRPGHADLVGGIKYDHSDMRNVLERASARETTMRVALGSIARCFLEELGIEIGSRVLRIGSADDTRVTPDSAIGLNERADRSPVRCLSRKAELSMIRAIDRAKRAGDTLGGEIEVIASGVPVGLGSYSQWDRRLEGSLAQSLMSLNAIKGVEIGLGFRAGSLLGSKSHDSILPGSRRGKLAYSANRSGGIDGGMSNGQPLVLRAAMKPLSTLMKPLPSVDLRTGKATRAHIERSDVCAVPAAAVIAESLVALVLADMILEKFGGDSMKEIHPRVLDWRKHTPIR